MLKIQGLRKRLGGFSLHIDELEIPSGSYFLLLGPSGSGKTVLLETLAGLNRIEQGTIFDGETDITRTPPERRGVGFVYQRGWLFPHLTVAQNIAFGLRYAGVVAAQAQSSIDELAGRMGIRHLLGRYPRKLSGGESQRVALARALAVRPKYLFLDEPLGPLDPAARETLARELKAWHREFGCTTVHVTHDHVEARTLADHVAVMFDGRPAQCGVVQDVFFHPAGERLARFVGSENIWMAEALDAGEGCVSVRTPGFTLPARSNLRGEVAVTVRPEDLVSADQGEAGSSDQAGRIVGTITELSDRGPMVRITLAAGGVPVVFYETPAESRRRGRGIGTPAELSVAASRVHVMPMTRELGLGERGTPRTAATSS